MPARCRPSFVPARACAWPILGWAGLSHLGAVPLFGPAPEPVKLVETDFQELFGASSVGCGLLIHATLGIAGGVGALFTNRSGWAA